ncbi:MAG: DUF6484 domain-containing protein [Burkholderiales bacterium]
MSSLDLTEGKAVEVAEQQTGADLLRPLVEAQPMKPAQAAAPAGVIVGELIAIANEGRTPMVLYVGQPGTAAVAARTTIDLHGPHIGRKVVLTFEGGDAAKPIVMGVLRDNEEGWPLAEKPGEVQIDADGQRLIVSAKEQVVLQCGKASITLTKAGKVLIQGTYVLSRSSGVNRVKGGSVQLN